MNLNSESRKNPREELLSLIAMNAYRYGDFTLSSGRKSSHYVNCKPVTLSGEGLVLLSKIMLEKVNHESVAVAGITLGGDPLVTAVSLQATQEGRLLDALIVRKEAKGHGTSSWLEGPLPPAGSKITVLEDVVTTGGSSLKAVTKLRDAGYIVEQIISIVDREEGGKIAINKAGIDLISIFLINEISHEYNKLIK